MNWTDEKVELLKKLRSQGLSKGQLAERFECTRNSISGKLGRLGLLQKQKERPRPRQLSAVPPRAEFTSRPTPGHRPDYIFGRSNTIKPWKTPALTPDEKEFVLGKGISLFDLTATSCRWPFNTPSLTETYVFCGHPTISGKPYCKYHDAIASN